MAELLILARDRIRCKKGEVAVAFPDGHSWGKEELNKDKFYIMRVSDMKLEEAKALARPLLNPDESIRWLRQYRIKIDHLSIADRNVLQSGTLEKQSKDIDITDKDTGQIIGSLER